MEEMKRVETGVVQFDNDWPGVFIRGDNALMLYAPLIRRVLGCAENVIERDSLRGLAELLESCEYRKTEPQKITCVPDTEALQRWLKENINSLLQNRTKHLFWDVATETWVLEKGELLFYEGPDFDAAYKILMEEK